jgi:exocyst complex component 4
MANMSRIEDVLQFIQQEWDFMTLDECVPVQVALQLMDPSSLGRADRYNEFQQTHTQLQRSLKSIVNEHHQGFNSSIGTFHKIQSSIQTSQGRIRYLKGSLSDAKGGLLTTKPELKGLATSSQSYDDTLQLLGQVENLQRVSEKLEARISEKRFLSSIDILQDALRLVRRSELEHISALSDMRAYFSNQETTLTDILIEELHDHLYLKSPYCQDRWKASHDGEKAIGDTMGSRGLNSWERPVYLFLSNLDTSTQLVEDASRNPEADSFYYIQVILESLNKMGHLDMAVDRIEHRLPVELFSVVDKTNAEVDHRHPDLRRNDLNEGKRKTALPNESTEGRGVVLSEFLWTLYSKFEAIAEGHRVVHEVVTGIVEREKIRDSKALTGGFRELWKLYQSEMRSLLHDYLAHHGDSTFGSGTTGADGGNMFQRRQRDKTKKMFKLSEMDQKSKEMIQEQEALDEILKTSVPGLVSKSRQSKSGAIVDSTRVGQDSSGTGHKLLVEPSVFNMSLLLPPSLSFLQRLKDIVPLNSDIVMSTLTSFLDEFLVNVFHPQLDEAITELCTQSFMELDAFQEDPAWSSYSPRPIFKVSSLYPSLIVVFVLTA